MKHWLVINWPGHWTAHEYDSDDEAYAAEERLDAKLGTNEPVRIQVFGADSLDVVKATHSAWFIGEEVTT